MHVSWFIVLCRLQLKLRNVSDGFTPLSVNRGHQRGPCILDAETTRLTDILLHSGRREPTCCLCTYGDVRIEDTLSTPPHLVQMQLYFFGVIGLYKGVTIGYDSGKYASSDLLIVSYEWSALMFCRPDGETELKIQIC